MAAMVGNLDILKMLIQNGCDCRVVNKVYLIFTFSFRFHSILKLINCCYFYYQKQYSVLHCAVKHDQNEIVAYLLDNVINLDIDGLNEVCSNYLYLQCLIWDIRYFNL